MHRREQVEEPCNKGSLYARRDAARYGEQGYGIEHAGLHSVISLPRLGIGAHRAIILTKSSRLTARVFTKRDEPSKRTFQSGDPRFVKITVEHDSTDCLGGTRVETRSFALEIEQHWSTPQKLSRLPPDSIQRTL